MIWIDPPSKSGSPRKGGDQGPLDPLVAADPEPDQEDVARRILLRQLTMAPRSRAELAKKLAEKNVPDEIATKVLDRFEEVRLIDDESFATSWVASRHRSKGLAKSALARELKNKGISTADVEVALEQIDADQEWSRGAELVERKMQNTRNRASWINGDRNEQDKLIRRMVGMLARKGYRPGQAFQIVKHVLEGIDGSDEID